MYFLKFIKIFMLVSLYQLDSDHFFLSLGVKITLRSLRCGLEL